MALNNVSLSQFGNMLYQVTHSSNASFSTSPLVWNEDDLVPADSFKWLDWALSSVRKRAWA